MEKLNAMLMEAYNFWFEELEPKDWWKKSDELDEQIKQRFSEHLELAKDDMFKPVRSSADSRLTEIIILDQFSRNIYRDKPESFSADRRALELSREAVELGEDLNLEKQKRHFLYMPYMHSESLRDHDEAVQLFTALGDEQTLKFEHAHRDIIVRFGRYPHRNKILDRESTAEEIEFLKGPGSSF